MATIPGYDPRFEPRLADAIPLDLVQQIWDEGLRVRWEKAARCACNLKVTYAADATYGFLSKEGEPSCPDCQGTGYLYYGAQEIRALVSATSDNPKWLELYGELADGSVQITTLPEHVPSKRDRFTVLDQVRRFDEQIVHKSNPEPLTYPIVVTPVTTGTSEADPYTPTTEYLGILNARRASSDGLIVTAPMVVGTDVAVTADGEVEYLDAGSYAEGFFLLDGAVANGVTVAVGDILENPDYPETNRWVVTVGGIFWAGQTTVGVKSTNVGAVYNLTSGSDTQLVVSGVTCLAEARDDFSGGTDPGVGGNVPAVGDVVAFDYYCNPSYIVRVLPHYAREAIVDATPYVNANGGDHGYWDPTSGTFPDDSELLRGDYYEVTDDGTVDGQAFVAGQVLVALVDAPSTTVYEGQWQALTRGVPLTRLAKLPTMVLCWLEDLGDPRQAPPQAP